MDQLHGVPGATDLFLFGSRATSTSDLYSDLDLELFTTDVVSARPVWPRFISRVAPIEVAFPLSGALLGMKADAAYTLLFRGESCYHTVDIGLRPSIDEAMFASNISEALRLWHQEPSNVHPYAIPGEVYIPAPDSAGYALVEELLCGVRYVKARKRDQVITCWRYMRSRVQHWLQLVSAEQRGWSEPRRSLTTLDFKALDGQLNRLERDEFERHLDWATPDKMDYNGHWFTQQIVSLVLRWAETRYEEVPSGVVARLLAFMSDELGLA